MSAWRPICQLTRLCVLLLGVGAYAADSLPLGDLGAMRLSVVRIEAVIAKK